MLLIVSQDADFTEVLAEQARRELAVAVQVAATPEAAKPLAGKAQLIVSDAPLAGQWSAPVLVVNKGAPISLSGLLSDMRRHLENGDSVLTFGRYGFSAQQKTVTNETGKTASLTDKEAQLLQLLIRAGQGGISRDALLGQVWGAAATELESHTLETHIYRLRAKLQDIGCEGITATQGGYTLEAK